MTIQDKSELPRTTLHQKIGNSLESRIAWYRKMRENHPVHYNQEHQDNQEHQVWEVFRYRDVQRVLLDHADFSVNVPDCEVAAENSAFKRAAPAASAHRRSEEPERKIPHLL